MNVSTPAINQAVSDESAAVKQNKVRKGRHAWSEAPNGHDLFLKRFSLVICVMMVAIMIGVLLKRLIAF